MLKDRGNKKWTSLMLVEHRKKLKKIKDKKDNINETKKQDPQEMNEIFQKAINENIKVKINLNKNRKIIYEGLITDWNLDQGQIELNDNIKIHIENIKRLKLT